MTTEQWQKAKEHLDAVHQAFVDLRQREGAIVAMALPLIVEPLVRRYYANERTDALYGEIMELKL